MGIFSWQETPISPTPQVLRAPHAPRPRGLAQGVAQ
jgi:hypothetical protein